MNDEEKSKALDNVSKLLNKLGIKAAIIIGDFGTATFYETTESRLCMINALEIEKRIMDIQMEERAHEIIDSRKNVAQPKTIKEAMTHYIG